MNIGLRVLMQDHEYDALPVGVLVLNPTLGIYSASAQFLRDFECSPEDLEGCELTELISARDRRATSAIDRSLNRASTTRLDTIAVLEVGARERLTRLSLTRTDEGWTAIVECIDGEHNLVHDLFSGQRRWSAALKGASDGFVFLDEDLQITDYNARFIELMGFRSAHGVLLAEEVLTGHPFVPLLEPEAYAGFRARLHVMWSVDGYHDELELHGRQLELALRPLYLPAKGLSGYGLSLRDISDRYLAERERAEREAEVQRHHAQIIEAQRRAIRSLTAPCIPITPELSVVPLIGQLDAERMFEITEDILEAVVHSSTRTLILDITGVPDLDEASTEALLSASRTLRLVGVGPVLTGVSPRLAQTIVEQGLDHRELEIYASVRDAIASTLQR